MRRKPLEEGLRWLRQAQEDLHWAQHLAEQGAYHLACFLAQQVAEKAIKGFLYGQGEEIVLGHLEFTRFGGQLRTNSLGCKGILHFVSHRCDLTN